MPNAKKSQIEGLLKNTNNDVFLKVSVSAIPEKNKANEALIKLLSKTWKFPKNSVNIVSGVTSRQKKIEITGNVETVYERINQWLKQKKLTENNTQSK